MSRSTSRFRRIERWIGALAMAALAACGEPTEVTAPRVPAPPSFFVSGATPAQVSASPANFFSCGTTTTGEAYCWGRNSLGQLGDGSTADSDLPVPVLGGLAFQSVSAGANHACGLTTAGAAYCWGSNSRGQLGDGSNIASGTPVAVVGGLAFQIVTAGSNHACGLTTTGIAYCWGLNQDGQLGDGTLTDSNVPVAVSGGLTFQDLEAGGAYTCSVTATAVAYCWGYNADRQLGDGTTTRRTTPTPVAGGLAFRSVRAGQFHTCGITTADDAYCWGYNGSGQIGNGITGNFSYGTPIAVEGGIAFQSLSVGRSHTCGVDGSAVAYCWGYNFYGQLGTGTNTNGSVPVPVTGGLSFSSISGGYNHTCGVVSTGAAYCTGWNLYGEVGDGTRDTRYAPVLVGGSPDDLPPVAVDVVADPNPSPVGATVALVATVSDEGTGDSTIESAEFQVGTGGYLPLSAADGTFDEVSEPVAVSFVAPAEAGLYDVCVRGTDEAGNVGDPECGLLVVYDPSAGFVTGGGWIDSPAGAYAADPSRTGKANFGFVSRYRKGRDVPDGNTEFQFRAGDLEFHATRYEFLVVNQGGSNAQFKGSGTVNGRLAPNATEYRFMIWARDGSPDTFRIKIWWDDGGEHVAYDNGFDQAIGGGSIVVHTKK